MLTSEEYVNKTLEVRRARFVVVVEKERSPKKREEAKKRKLEE